MKNQREQIKAYLETHYGITAKQAMEELGIYRLASRISELKQAGVPIRSQMIEVENRHGEKIRVKLYWLTGKPEEAFK